MLWAVRYVDTIPNVLALCSFADQDLGGWHDCSMTMAGDSRLHARDQDYDELPRNGWQLALGVRSGAEVPAGRDVRGH